MRYRKPVLPLLLLPVTLIVFASIVFYADNSVTSQTRDKSVNANAAPTRGPQAGSPLGVAAKENDAGRMPAVPQSADVVKVDVDLVKVDALVLQKNTARIVGGLKKEDFLIYEDGTKQEITHFSQDMLPLSVLLVIDRGGCVDPYVDEVHRAAREAIDRLKPVDEIAVMAFANTSVLIQPFTRNRIMIENALNSLPPQAAFVDHCLNNAFADAADYMIKASNPVGRRVVIVITGVTRRFDCPDGPSGKSAANAIYESGSVVCGILPKVPTQGIENGMVKMATRVTKIAGADYMDIQTLANETGGEVLSDKPEILDTTFQTLIDHLRSRYNLAFVSTNKKRDGTTRKLKLDLTPSIQKSQGKLVVKARRRYIAPRN
jgi:Ca-activated chloride channel family protein